MDVAERVADDARRTETVVALATALGAQTIACYLSIPPEPDTRDLVDALVAEGFTVLAPVLTKGALVDGRRPPAWATYTGRDDLVPGWHGIDEPGGQHVDASGLATADLVITSALLGARDGVRLGVGGGWYDRALASARPDAPIITLLHRGELVDHLPSDDFDRRVDAFVLPQAVIWIDAGSSGAAT